MADRSADACFPRRGIGALRAGYHPIAVPVTHDHPCQIDVIGESLR